jgi:hypothetical protein
LLQHPLSARRTVGEGLPPPIRGRRAPATQWPPGRRSLRTWEPPAGKSNRSPGRLQRLKAARPGQKRLGLSRVQ